MSLLIGYAVAGILLFGHQNAGFESLSPAILNLLIMLLAWDPYTWVQVLIRISLNFVILTALNLFWSFFDCEFAFSVESCCS
jgi:hypothetical protein